MADGGRFKVTLRTVHRIFGIVLIEALQSRTFSLLRVHPWLGVKSTDSLISSLGRSVIFRPSSGSRHFCDRILSLLKLYDSEKQVRNGC